MVYIFRKKSKKININQSNKNDIIKILGPPSTTSYLIMIFGYILREEKLNQN